MEYSKFHSIPFHSRFSLWNWNGIFHMYVRMYYVNYKLYLSTYYHVQYVKQLLPFSRNRSHPLSYLFFYVKSCTIPTQRCVIGSRQFDSNSSGIFQIPRIVELRNSIPHFPLGMEMEPTSKRDEHRRQDNVTENQEVQGGGGEAFASPRTEDLLKKIRWTD